MAHGDIMNPVERPKTRYGMLPDEAKTHRLLSDPIEFSQNIARELYGTDLDGVFSEDMPKQLDDLRTEFEYMVDQAIERHDKLAAKDVFNRYTEFITYAIGEAHEYGIAIGAIMEQLRTGVAGVADLSRRGLIYGDVMQLKDLQKLRRQHDMKCSSLYAETDLMRAERDLDREEAK